jgi:hypothetical protein
MSHDDTSFQNLLVQLENGHPSAAARVFDRFSDRLVALARSRLNPQLLQRVDPEDVTKSVFRSFFQRQEAGLFSLETWGSLWGLLVTMTVRKCRRRADEFYAARRNDRQHRVTESYDQAAGFSVLVHNNDFQSRLVKNHATSMTMLTINPAIDVA